MKLRPDPKGFEKIELERISWETCKHEFVTRLDIKGWLPKEECRKCKMVKSVDFVYPEEASK